MSSGTAKSMLLYPMLLPAFCGIAVAVVDETGIEKET